MECDSVHRVIEKKLKKIDYYLPSHLSQLTKDDKNHSFPYISKLLTFKLFTDYSNKNRMYYESIRPGRVASVVTDLRVIEYCPRSLKEFAKKTKKNLNQNIFLCFPTFISPLGKLVWINRMTSKV